jgi:hypothetical protein
MQQLGPEEAAIPSRWQNDAVPPWRRISTELVCEIQATTIDLSVMRTLQMNLTLGKPCVNHTRDYAIVPASVARGLTQ